MKPYNCVFVLLGILCSPAQAGDNYVISPGTTMPYFEITQLGFTTLTGHFRKTSGNASIDLKAKTGSVDLTIYTDSIDTGTGWLEAWSAHLSDEGLFNVKNFPIMTFKSDKFIFSGNQIVAADGQFTMLGVTRPLTITVSNFHCTGGTANKKAACAGDVSAQIKRSDFGLTKYTPMVSDEVKIKVPVEVTQ